MFTNPKVSEYFSRIPIFILSGFSALLILCNSWPGLGAAWSGDTLWSWIVTRPEARIAFLVAALLVVWSAWRHKNRLRIIVALPLCAATLLPLDALTLEADLLRSPRILADRGEKLEEFGFEKPSELQIYNKQPAILQSLVDRYLNFWPAPVALAAAWEEGGFSEVAHAKLTKSIVDERHSIQSMNAKLVKLQNEQSKMPEWRCFPTPSGERKPDNPRDNCVPNPDHVEWGAKIKAQQKLIEEATARLAASVSTVAVTERAAELALSAVHQQAYRHMLSLLVALLTALAVVAVSLFDKDGDWLFPAVLGFTLIAIGVERYGVSLDKLTVLVRSDEPITYGGMLRASGHFTGFAAVFLSARCLHVLARHNLNLLPAFQRREIFGVLGLTLFFWSPLGFAAWYSTNLSSWFESQFQDMVYSIEVDPKYGFATNPCDQTTRLIYEEICGERAAEFDLQASIANWLDELELRTPALTSSAEDFANLSAENTAEYAERLMDQYVPDWLAKKPHSGEGTGVTDAFNHDESPWPWQIVRKFKKGIKARSDRSYIMTRARVEIWLEHKLTELVAEVEEGSEITGEALNSLVARALDAMRQPARDQVWMAFRSWDVLQWVGALVLMIAILKSSGYVFGRVLHSRLWYEEMFRVRLSENNQEEKPLPLVRVSNGQSLPLLVKDEFKYLLWVQPTGLSRDGMSLHQPWVMAFRRFTPMRQLFQQGAGGGPQKPASFNTTRGRTFAEIDLLAGSSINFDIGALYALSPNVRLNGVWDFGIENLMRGRIRQCRASVRKNEIGHIYLRLKGEASEPGANVAPAQLVAWSEDTHFIARSKITLRSIFTGGVMFEELPGSAYVADVGKAQFTGAILFFPALLLPL